MKSKFGYGYPMKLERKLFSFSRECDKMKSNKIEREDEYGKGNI